ncbi:hypothetical protein D3C71_389410 [compost metagenome]
MKKILAFTILSLTFLSCKKDKIEPLTPESPATTSYVHVKTTGSYWVYDWYDVDSIGNETLWATSWKDTMRIVGDTTINGKVFQHYKGKEWNSPREYYNRDSSGYVVGINGKIAYSYISGPMLLSANNDGYLNNDGYIGEKQTINTAFGSKQASTTYHQVSMVDGTPVNVCGDLSVRFYSYYVSGLGCVGTETAYISQLQGQCSKKRSKLSAYYIAP